VSLKKSRLVILASVSLLICFLNTGLSSSYSVLRNLGISANDTVKIDRSHPERSANSITVKVISGLTSGSGIIISHEGTKYRVITNDHVLIFGREKGNYSIKTPDNQIYPARIITINSLKGYDLGLLEFDSPQIYETAIISGEIQPSEIVWAAGFPSETAELFISEGEIQTIAPRSFAGGYQIGLTISIKKGMSGGPLLNDRGEVIGINGIHKYPLWGNPYIFQDGTRANMEEKSQMSQLSWAIPMDTLLKLLPQYISHSR
jgi:serine protease Do